MHTRSTHTSARTRHTRRRLGASINHLIVSIRLNYVKLVCVSCELCASADTRSFNADCYVTLHRKRAATRARAAKRTYG